MWTQAASIAVVLALEATAPAQTLPARPAGNSDNGKRIYMKYGCYECHGREGQGPLRATRLAPGPIPFPAFVRSVRAPIGDMPPYTAKVVSEEELADIYAFLLSRPAPAKTLPLLR